MEGGCHCGAIRFQVTEKPFWIGACYCIDCRKISGSPYTVFAGYNKKSVELLQGTPKEYASSEHVRRSFCEVCGSPFSYVYIGTDENNSVFIPVGIFDDPNDLKTQEHIWVSQKLPWISIHDDLPQREK